MSDRPEGAVKQLENGRWVVHRVEDGVDRQDVACSVYQMRNFYRQLNDGFFSRLDVFNYASHHQIAHWASKARGRVLDVCCGRGLLLPLLRYHAPHTRSYTGLDIRPENATWQNRRVTDGKPVDPEDYYPFETRFVEANVAEADVALEGEQFDLIVYTASIEHMHPEDGRRSLHALRRLAAPGSLLVLTCPNTPAGQDGYDTRYRAHVYEWSLGELHAALRQAEWRVTDEWGLDMGVRELAVAMEETGQGELFTRLRKFVPQEWLVPALAPQFPEQAREVGLLCKPRDELSLKV